MLKGCLKNLYHKAKWRSSTGLEIIVIKPLSVTELAESQHQQAIGRCKAGCDSTTTKMLDSNNNNTVETPYNVTPYNVKFAVTSVFRQSPFFSLFVFVKYDSI